jgi:hypothetical protein
MNVALCEELIKEYDVIGKQLYRLREAWSKFSRKPFTKTDNQTNRPD